MVGAFHLAIRVIHLMPGLTIGLSMCAQRVNDRARRCDYEQKDESRIENGGSIIAILYPPSPILDFNYAAAATPANSLTDRLVPRT
jgi:hypothetical protein